MSKKSGIQNYPADLMRGFMGALKNIGIDLQNDSQEAKKLLSVAQDWNLKISARLDEEARKQDEQNRVAEAENTAKSMKIFEKIVAKIFAKSFPSKKFHGLSFFQGSYFVGDSNRVLDREEKPVFMKEVVNIYESLCGDKKFSEMAEGSSMLHATGPRVNPAVSFNEGFVNKMVSAFNTLSEFRDLAKAGIDDVAKNGTFNGKQGVILSGTIINTPFQLFAAEDSLYIMSKSPGGDLFPEYEKINLEGMLATRFLEQCKEEVKRLSSQALPQNRDAKGAIQKVSPTTMPISTQQVDAAKLLQPKLQQKQVVEEVTSPRIKNRLARQANVDVAQELPQKQAAKGQKASPAFTGRRHTQQDGADTKQELLQNKAAEGQKASPKPPLPKWLQEKDEKSKSRPESPAPTMRNKSAVTMEKSWLQNKRLHSLSIIT